MYFILSVGSIESIIFCENPYRYSISIPLGESILVIILKIPDILHKQLNQYLLKIYVSIYFYNKVAIIM